ncbi:MAG: YggT family protein [Rhodoferax sp.]
MPYQIISFLLDIIIGLLGSAFLLRLYMQFQRVPFGNPVGRFVFALTDWLVLPLRRIVPAAGRWDLASLVAAFLLVLAQYVVLWLLEGAESELVFLPVLAAFGLIRLVISGLTGLLIVYAVMSWVQSAGGSALFRVIERLCEPLLRPIRRIVPLIGGIDLSPLVLLVLLQVASMVWWSIQGAVLG